MREWLKRAVLKTAMPQGIVSSNLTASAPEIISRSFSARSDPAELIPRDFPMDIPRDFV